MKGLKLTSFSQAKLKDVVKLPSLLKETPAKIEEVWNIYHGAWTDRVSCVLSSSQHALYATRAREFPYFMFLVPRKDNSFTLASSVQGTFSTLQHTSEVQKDPKFARAFLCIDVFEELLATKLIAPVRGVFDPALLSRSEAELLMRAFFFFYLEDSHFALVRQYSQGQLDPDAYTAAISELGRF
jgi:hypothetical protein